MRRIFNCISVVSVVVFSGLVAQSFACSDQDFNRYNQQGYTARAVLFQRDQLLAQQEVDSAASSLQHSPPDRGSEYNGAEFHLAMESYLTTRSINERVVNESSSKVECYGRLAAEFGKIGRYQDLIQQQFLHGFATELDRAVWVYQWRSTLTDRKQKIQLETSTTVDRFVGDRFPQLYDGLADLGAPVEYTNIGRYSLMIDQQYSRPFDSFMALGDRTYEWDRLINSKIEQFQRIGAGNIVVVYQALSKKVNQALHRAVVRN